MCVGHAEVIFPVSSVGVEGGSTMSHGSVVCLGSAGWIGGRNRKFTWNSEVCGAILVVLFSIVTEA
jgi:hypothetical protein